VAAATLAAAQALGQTPVRPSAELRSYVYRDNSGLTVITGAATTEAPLSPRFDVWARLVVDHISLDRQVLDPADPGAAAQLTGHHHTDAVTSASAVAGGGGVAQKQRYEGTAGLRLNDRVRELPVNAQALLRAGYEPDYRSVSGQLSGGLELFERNTTVTAVLGIGSDSVRPIEEPPGPPERFPAAHTRLSAGAALGQVISPRIVARVGATAVFQRGTLSNPYRRAAVLPHGAMVGTLFPEVLPSARDRYTGFLAGSFALGRRTALHLQQGAYADSWGVRAFIPELLLSQDFGVDAGGWPLVNLRYRYYRQSGARFHTDHYHDLEPLMSGDTRLGATVDHTAGVDLRWPLLRRQTGGGSLFLEAGYAVTILDYKTDHTGRIVGHIPTVALAGGF
jgi:hypothetical protein